MVFSFLPFTKHKESEVVKVENVIVYKHFFESGKTSAIIDEFKSADKTAIDSILLSDFNQTLSSILRQKSKRLRNMNIVVEFAGEFFLSPSNKHYFVIHRPYHLIDLTEKRIYYITDVQTAKKTRDLVRFVKRKQGLPEDTPFITRVPYKEMPDSVLYVLKTIDDIDEYPFLNSQESAYIKSMFLESDRMPDLTGKKILFHYTNRGQINKKEFFAEEKEWYAKGITPAVCLYLFNEDQKNAVGGYDAYIVLWSKISYPTDYLVKRFSKNNSKRQKY